MENEWSGIGRLGKAPEVRFTPSGKAVASFSIACSEVWYDKDGKKQEKTEWVNIVCWDRTAENVGQYTDKGSLVRIKGPLQTRKYDDKNGVTRYVTEVVARRVIFLDHKKQDTGSGSHDSAGGAPLSDDDIPF